MHRRLVQICVSWLAAATISIVAAQPASPEAEIRGALMRWMEDFNAGRADKVCDIFAPSLVADVSGAAQRDFAAQCKLLRSALDDPKRSLSYAVDVKEVLAEGDLAVVRLVWTLTTRVKSTGQVSTTKDQGLDVFGKGSDGSWRIIRYMTYERP
jgi:ketosteroid isomerase-like protein